MDDNYIYMIPGDPLEVSLDSTDKLNSIIFGIGIFILELLFIGCMFIKLNRL